MRVIGDLGAESFSESTGKKMSLEKRKAVPNSRSKKISL